MPYARGSLPHQVPCLEQTLATMILHLVQSLASRISSSSRIPVHPVRLLRYVILPAFVSSTGYIVDIQSSIVWASCGVIMASLRQLVTIKVTTANGNEFKQHIHAFHGNKNTILQYDVTTRPIPYRQNLYRMPVASYRCPGSDVLKCCLYFLKLAVMMNTSQKLKIYSLPKS